MGFEHACFISYVRPKHDLNTGFIAQLSAALKGELEPWMDEDVYIDEEGIGPGDQHSERLAKAICESVCMIVVWSPKYERHDYCMREFQAMTRFQTRRRELLGQLSHGQTFIIPVILRGGSYLPDYIKECIDYSDFSSFTLAETDISRNPGYLKEIRRVAERIYERYRLFKDIGLDVCTTCGEERLPSSELVASWLRQPQPFVNR
jgi:hypothetical protein